MEVGHMSIRGYRFTCCLISLLTETVLLAPTGGSPPLYQMTEDLIMNQYSPLTQEATSL